MLPETWGLNGRVVIITGGAGFLGREYAHVVARAEGRPVIADINGAAAVSVEAEVRETTGGEALAVTADVTDARSVSAMVRGAVERFGRIDALVNNAAIDPKFDAAHAYAHGSSFEAFPLAEWNAALAVNVTGPFLCAQAVAPYFRAAGRGIIVNVSSIYGLVGPDQRLYETGQPGAPHLYKPVTYSVTKSAVFGLTRYLATYWAGTDIRVNTLTLGGVFHDHDQGFTARYGIRTPMGRMARPAEAANALIFLLSDASSYMTGANLVVDGGWTAW